MATVYLAPFIGAGGQFFTNNGSPLAGGSIFTYVAGTTTPQATFTDNTGNTAQPNPIVLDSSGRVPGSEIWVTTALYKFVVQDSTGVTLITSDNIGVTTTVLLSTVFATSTTSGTVIVPATSGASVDGAGNITIPGLKALTTLGDLPYVSATASPGTLARLAGNTVATQAILTQTGDGVNSAAPVWSSSLKSLTLSTGISNPGILLTLGLSSALANDRKLIQFTEGGFASPGTFNTASSGDKVQLSAAGGNVNYDACFGIGASSNLWAKSVNNTGNGGIFEWWMGNPTSGFVKHMTLSPGGFVLNNVGGNQETGFAGGGGTAPTANVSDTTYFGVNFKTTMATMPAAVAWTVTSSSNLLPVSPTSTLSVTTTGVIYSIASKATGAANMLYYGIGTYVTS